MKPVSKIISNSGIESVQKSVNPLVNSSINYIALRGNNIS